MQIITLIKKEYQKIDNENKKSKQHFQQQQQQQRKKQLWKEQQQQQHLEYCQKHCKLYQ